MSDDPNQTSPNEAAEIALKKKALRKLGLRLRKASEGYLSMVGHNDTEILKQIDFTVADLQQLIAAISFEKAYFTKLAMLFAKSQGENVEADVIAAQKLGISEGSKAAQEFFNKSKKIKPATEKPA